MTIAATIVLNGQESPCVIKLDAVTIADLRLKLISRAGQGRLRRDKVVEWLKTQNLSDQNFERLARYAKADGLYSPNTVVADIARSLQKIAKEHLS